MRQTLQCHLHREFIADTTIILKSLNFLDRTVFLKYNHRLTILVKVHQAQASKRGDDYTHIYSKMSSKISSISPSTLINFYLEFLSQFEPFSRCIQNVNKGLGKLFHKTGGVKSPKIIPLNENLVKPESRWAMVFET
jgi:hypothetical protein